MLITIKKFFSMETFVPDLVWQQIYKFVGVINNDYNVDMYSARRWGWAARRREF